MSDFMGFIVSFQHSDNYAMFYKEDCTGYTYNIDEAGKYTCKEGLEIQKSTHGKDVWVSENEIYDKMIKTVETAKIKPLNEIEQFAARLYDWLIKTELGEDGFQANCFLDYNFNGYEIVNEPRGSRQPFVHEALDENDDLMETPQEFKYIDHEYCDQWQNGGMEGDSYAGDIYFPLPNGQYMKCYYEC